MIPKKHKTGADAEVDAPNLAALPRDVLAYILVLLPASDLRRFRRVCKELRSVISGLTFIDAHMLYPGRRAPTHTIVFYPGRRRSNESLSGGGFLFDEQCRLTARFTVDESAEMIGTCKGLLCFRDSAHGVIKVVEPFTGDSIALPLPPTADAGTCSTAAYCFGFDATARRCKVVHGVFRGKVSYDGYFFAPANIIENTVVEQELHVFTVGADTEWRTVPVSAARHGTLYGDPACGDDGAVHWYSHNDGYYRNVRLDLATEKVTSELRRLVASEMSCWYCPVTFNPCFIGFRWFGELQQDGGWSNNINQAAAHETYMKTHPRWCLPGPQALQRGHLLLARQKERDLRACASVESTVSSLDIGFLWDSKLLIETGTMEEEEPAEKFKLLG